MVNRVSNIIGGNQSRLLLYGVGLVALLVLPGFMPNEYVFRVVIAVIIDIPLALSQNLITGYAGLLTLGQAAFYGIGAYTSALLVMRLGAPWPFWPLACWPVSLASCWDSPAYGWEATT